MYAFCILLAAPNTWAHHSATAYDLKRTVALKGVLKELNFENPHVNLILDVKGDDGKIVSYRIEGNPPGWFRQAGIRRADFDKGIGQPVTVDVHPSKDGAPIGYFQKITFADGTYLRFADVTQ
jgi:hypothetical protein